MGLDIAGCVFKVVYIRIMYIYIQLNFLLCREISRP